MTLSITLSLLLISGFLSSAAATTLPPGFVETTYASGLTSPTAMEFAPDGRLFVCLQGGNLRVIKNGVLLPTPFVSLTVDSAGERGLLGIAFDPNFATNNFVYVYYTVPGDPAHNRVSRFTANGDVAVAGSEFIVLDLDNLSGAGNHNGGAIHFGPDGKLYIAVGENANRANSQTLANLLGKVLRINVDGTPPPSDNPFFNNAGARKEIWALGLRNPFTFAFQPGTGRIFINDVGETTWEEINDGIAGSNYGWPITEGPTTDPSFRAPLFAYGHGGSSSTGCAITGGAFYNPTTAQFPAGYTGKYFFADLCNGWIRVLDPSNNTAADFAGGTSSTVDLKVGADGSLYYLVYQGSVFKIQYSPPDPVITTHPVNQTVMQGQTATFNVSASGSTPPTYQWQRNMVNISGANSSSYTTPATVFADNGAKFRCVVSNTVGTANSNEATLTVNAPPNITSHPANATAAQGQPATFSVSAGGSTPFTYQWQRNLVNISGANSSSYTIPATVFADNGAKFRCVVTNAFGTANSNEATLTVNAPPNITTHPANVTVAQGQPATFSISATGSTPFTYQWQRNLVNISGANSSSYTTPATVFADNGAKFRCVVTNAFGAANSNEATLTVNAPPNITTHPANVTVAQGQPATFSINATGSTPFTYQWQRNLVNISGANSSSHTIPATVLADNGAKFRCVVTNAFGTANSNEASLTVNAPPNITSHPADVTAAQGQPATFSVSAGGSTPLAYQWQRNLVNISGASSPSYTVPATVLADNGAKFRCVVTNAFGTANSNEATLTILPPGLILQTEENTDRAIALEPGSMLRDPFSLANVLSLTSDKRTRVMLFAINLDLLPSEDSSAVTARAEDVQMILHPVTVEFVGKVPAFAWLTELIVILPADLPAGQDVLLSVTYRTQTSNKVRIKIK